MVGKCSITLNVNFEAMEKEIEDLLRHTNLKESEIEWLKQELLNLHIVMLSEIIKEVEVITVLRDDGKSSYSLGESQGFESGAEWVIDAIKDKLHSA